MDDSVTIIVIYLRSPPVPQVLGAQSLCYSLTWFRQYWDEMQSCLQSVPDLSLAWHHAEGLCSAWLAESVFYSWNCNSLERENNLLAFITLLTLGPAKDSSKGSHPFYPKASATSSPSASSHIALPCFCLWAPSWAPHAPVPQTHWQVCFNEHPCTLTPVAWLGWGPRGDNRSIPLMSRMHEGREPNSPRAVGWR